MAYSVQTTSVGVQTIPQRPKPPISSLRRGTVSYQMLYAYESRRLTEEEDMKSQVSNLLLSHLSFLMLSPIVIKC